MPSYSGGVSDTTPATNADNYTLSAITAGDVGRVLSIGWGGELTTSTGYKTRWVRPTTAGVTPVGITVEDHNPGHSAPLLELNASYTTAPVVPAATINLFIQSWNAHGGLGYVALPLANPWILINGVQTGELSCRNVDGVDANGSSYQITWEE